MARIDWSFTASHPDDEDVHDRFLAGPFGRAAAHGEADGLAQFVLARSALQYRLGRGVARFLEESLAILLDRNALERDLDVADEPVLGVQRQCHRNDSEAGDLAPLVHRCPVGGEDDVAVEDQPSDPLLAELDRPVRSEPDDVSILLEDALGHALRARETLVLGHVAHLAVDGDDDLGPDPAVHGGELRPAGMAGDVDVRLPVRDHLDAAGGELVLDPADGDLVARYLLGGEDDEVALAE